MNYYLSLLSSLARLEVLLIRGNVNMKDIYGTITRLKRMDDGKDRFKKI